MYAMFKSLSSRDVDLWWVGGDSGLVSQGTLHAGEITSTNANEGDRFVITEKVNQNNVLSRFTLQPDKV